MGLQQESNDKDASEQERAIERERQTETDCERERQRERREWLSSQPSESRPPSLCLFRAHGVQLPWKRNLICGGRRGDRGGSKKGGQSGERNTLNYLILFLLLPSVLCVIWWMFFLVHHLHKSTKSRKENAAKHVCIQFQWKSDKPKHTSKHAHTHTHTTRKAFPVDKPIWLPQLLSTEGREGGRERAPPPPTHTLRHLP